MLLNLSYARHVPPAPCSQCSQVELDLEAEAPAPLAATDLTSYVRSNYSASPAEAASIRGVLSLIDADVASYDAQIHRLEDALRAIRRRKSTLEDAGAQLASLTAPVRRLPREILGIICEYTALNRWFEDESGWHVLVCSQVCHEWREVAFAAQGLWTHIRVSGDKEGYLEMVETYARRAGTRSLSANVNLWNSCSRQRFTVWAFIAREAHRLESLHLQLPTVDLPVRLPSNLPLLATLHVAAQGNPFEPSSLEAAEKSVLRLRSSAPCLRALGIDRIHLISLDVDWGGLRQLTLRDTRALFGDLLRILRQCTSLEVLQLGPDQAFRNAYDTDDYEANTVHLPRLVQLHTYRNAMGILPYLLAENAQDLCVDHGEELFTEPMLLKRSFPTLKTLTLQNMHHTSLPNLKDLASVQCLRLHQNVPCATHFPLLDSLTIDDDVVDEIALPGLTELEIVTDMKDIDDDNFYWHDEDEGAVKEMVMSRIGVPQEGVSSLKRLRVHAPNATFSDEFRDWLTEVDIETVTFADATCYTD
ncbi:uncharacterized protein SCHCODRAFT_02632939 [Schizophyllum commune H4-8]|nr:uncharacterized protein SCHCODRAFT_02632939 [Schizophyllum commune H4-8]KAI5890805.1 hypothetical protein SCHCODRAFT_02632939 [Schizophyllum commune H4-8]